jgi:allantoate deiminase
MTGSSQISIDQQILRTAANRVVDRCDILAKHSEQTGCLTRTFCERPMKDAHETLEGWMHNAQMKCRLDAVGNLIGCLDTESENGTAASSPVFMIGSHIDTVINGGRFDGALGILLGLAAAEVIVESEIQLGFELHVVAFSEEEGVRYGFPFIGSRGIAGMFDPKDFDREDCNGVTIRDALTEFGGDPAALEAASYANRDLVGFLEPHIEQAVLLQDENLPVGVVSAIAGQTRATIVFEGKAGHAGTVPHDKRHDALAAAAELILKTEQLGQQTIGLFATIGSVEASPGLSNVICGRTELKLDLRHEFDASRLAAFETFQQLIEAIANSRGVTHKLTGVEHTPAVPMDAELTQHLQSSISDTGSTAKMLVSGAGHDAMIMSSIAPSCMLFVRCRDGISHHPDEFVSSADIFSTLKVMVGALIKISNSRSQAIK